MQRDTTSISFLTVNAVCQRCGISRQTLFRLRQRQAFPVPCYPGGIKSPRWRSDAITDWIERESETTAA